MSPRRARSENTEQGRKRKHPAVRLRPHSAKTVDRRGRGQKRRQVSQQWERREAGAASRSDRVACALGTSCAGSCTTQVRHASALSPLPLLVRLTTFLRRRKWPSRFQGPQIQGSRRLRHCCISGEFLPLTASPSSALLRPTSAPPANQVALLPWSSDGALSKSACLDNTQAHTGTRAQPTKAVTCTQGKLKLGSQLGP